MHAFHRNFSDRPCQRRTSTRLFESAIGLPDQQASDHSLIRLPVLQPRSVLFAQMRNSVRLITQISLSTVDCANKAKVTIRKAYGFRTFGAMEIALYHALGKLPEPQLTHRFY